MSTPRDPVSPRPPVSTYASGREMVRHAAAAFFILASPFLVFLRHHRYPYLRSEVLLCSIAIAAASALVGLAAWRWRHAAPIALAASITLFIDVQFGILNDGYALAAAFAVVWAGLMPFPAHATRALAAAGVVTFGMTFLLPVSAEGIHSPRKTSSGPSTLPPIVHVVLDGHIGVEGLQGVVGGEPLGNELRAFYRRRGFLLFGGAYSEHFETFRSLSHEFNFLPGQHASGLYAKDGRSHAWRLTRNAYFDDLVRTGYNVTVYQSTFLNVCVNVRALAGCADTASVVSPRDYVDSYSTLFAVRAPKLAPGYNEEMLPIACLLKALAEADYEHTSDIAACASPPAVFVAASGGRIEAQPLAPFD